MSTDEIFDPEIHAADKDGNPTFNKDGSFRKKRKDTGTRRAARGAGGARKSAAPAGSQKEQYAKAWNNTLGVGVMIASFVDPVDGYCAGELSPLMADALADLAVDNPAMAALTERLAVGSAVGSVFAVGLLATAQFMHNHGKMPAHLATAVGAKPRSEIEKILEQRGVMLRRQAPAPEPEPQHARAVPTPRDLAGMSHG